MTAPRRSEDARKELTAEQEANLWAAVESTCEMAGITHYSAIADLRVSSAALRSRLAAAEGERELARGMLLDATPWVTVCSLDKNAKGEAMFPEACDLLPRIYEHFDPHPEHYYPPSAKLHALGEAVWAFESFHDWLYHQNKLNESSEGITVLNVIEELDAAKAARNAEIAASRSPAPVEEPT